MFSLAFSSQLPLEITFLLKWLDIKSAHIRTQDEVMSVVWKSLSTLFRTRRNHKKKKNSHSSSGKRRASGQKSWVFSERVKNKALGTHKSSSIQYMHANVRVDGIFMVQKWSYGTVKACEATIISRFARTKHSPREHTKKKYLDIWFASECAALTASAADRSRSENR